MLIINGLDELASYAGKELGVSDWLLITQERVAGFADATNDHQWIHLDQERAAKESPFKTTVAHGFLTLSLAPYFLDEIMEVKNTSMKINYGLDKVRFTSPVPVGSNLRMRLKLSEVKRRTGMAICTYSCTFEVEGSPKAACEADILLMFRD